ncbi:Uncharacterised protein [Clostridium perfringens]|nr:Uncharacterised protein [Clostridium perfringens]
MLKISINLNVLKNKKIKKEYQDTDQSSRGTQRVKQYHFNILKCK